MWYRCEALGQSNLAHHAIASEDNANEKLIFVKTCQNIKMQIDRVLLIIYLD